jgi:hypothetical protein
LQQDLPVMNLYFPKAKSGLDKNDYILQELFDRGNFKQALANIDKRLKKSPKDEGLLVRPKLQKESSHS